MYCPKCGNEINRNEKFCKNCGNKLNIPEVSPKKRVNKKIIFSIAGIGVVTLAVFGVLLAAILSGKNESSILDKTENISESDNGISEKEDECKVYLLSEITTIRDEGTVKRRMITYNENGILEEIEEISEDDHEKIEFYYDADSLLFSGSSDTGRIFTFQADDTYRFRECSVSYLEGDERILERVYDEKGLVQYFYKSRFGLQEEYYSYSKYNAEGKPLAGKTSDGDTFEYEYDDIGNMIKETIYNSEGTKFCYEYMYDGDKLISAKYTYEGLEGQEDHEEREYEYDDKGNLSRIKMYGTEGDMYEEEMYTYKEYNIPKENAKLVDFYEAIFREKSMWMDI